MFFPKPAAWLVFASTCGAVIAQQAPSSPLLPGQASPPPYRSAVEGYQRFTDQKVAPWRESNDTVGRIGGWKAYAREARDAAAAPAPATPSSAPATGGEHKH